MAIDLWGFKDVKDLEKIQVIFQKLYSRSKFQL